MCKIKIKIKITESSSEHMESRCLYNDFILNFGGSIGGAFLRDLLCSQGLGIKWFSL